MYSQPALSTARGCAPRKPCICKSTCRIHYVAIGKSWIYGDLFMIGNKKIIFHAGSDANFVIYFLLLLEVLCSSVKTHRISSISE